MKQLLQSLLILCLIFVACENEETHTSNPSDAKYGLTITTSKEVSVGCGTVIGFIHYSIANPIEDGKFDAAADVVWVTQIDISKNGQVTYHIARNESVEPRTAIITLTYEDESQSVVITQAGVEPDTIIEAPMLTGHYYGQIATPLYNYYLCFTDKGLDSNYLTSMPDAYYYIVDLFLEEEPVDDNLRVPNGIYTYDESSGAPGTFAYFSWYQETNSNGFPVLQRPYTSGTLVVEDNKLTLTVLLEANNEHPAQRHVVIYEGDYSLINMGY